MKEREHERYEEKLAGVVVIAAALMGLGQAASALAVRGKLRLIRKRRLWRGR